MARLLRGGLRGDVHHVIILRKAGSEEELLSCLPVAWRP